MTNSILSVRLLKFQLLPMLYNEFHHQPIIPAVKDSSPLTDTNLGRMFWEFNDKQVFRHNHQQKNKKQQHCMRHKSQTKRYQPNVFTLSLVWGWSCCCFAVDEGLYRNINTYITRVTIWTTILECQNEISSPTKSMTAHTRTGYKNRDWRLLSLFGHVYTLAHLFTTTHTNTHTPRSLTTKHSLARSLT